MALKLRDMVYICTLGANKSHLLKYYHLGISIIVKLLQNPYITALHLTFYTIPERNILSSDFAVIVNPNIMVAMEVVETIAINNFTT